MSILKKALVGLVAAATVSVAFAAGHGNAPEAGTVKYTGPKMDLSKYQPEFRIGFLGDEAAQDVLTRNSCMKPYIEAAYGVPAKLFTFEDYAGNMQAMLGGNLDYTWYGSSGYAGMELEKPGFVVPVLTRMQPTGDMGYYSVMIARKDSGIKTLADTKGKRLGFADPNSTSGYLIPSIELPATPEVNGPLENYFSSTEFSGGHSGVVLAVLNGDIDVGFNWVSGVGEWSEGYTSGNLRKMVDAGQLNMDDIVQVWSSALIPNGPIAMPAKWADGSSAEQGHKVMQGMKDWIHKNDPKCSENVANGVVKSWMPVDKSFYDSIIKARKAKIEAKKSG